MPQPLNPDTHCPTCGEVLSEYGHCWQHHYPPMDPAQDAAPAPTGCGKCHNAFPAQRCLACVNEPDEKPYCNGQCGICSCISSPQAATATPSNG